MVSFGRVKFDMPTKKTTQYNVQGSVNHFLGGLHAPKGLEEIFLEVYVVDDNKPHCRQSWCQKYKQLKDDRTQTFINKMAAEIKKCNKSGIKISL